MDVNKINEYEDYFDMSCACKGANLDKMLQASILQTLYDKDLYGIAVIEELGKGPMYRGSKPDKAGVYRYLKRMEGQGLLVTRQEVDTDDGRERTFYSITDQGRQCMLNWYQVLRQYVLSLENLTEQLRQKIMQT